MPEMSTQYVEIPVAGGLDTFTAPERVASPRNLQLRDVSLREPGVINKRRSYAELPGTTADGTTIGALASGFRAMLTNGDTLIGIHGQDGKAYAWLEAEQRWIVVEKSAAFPVTHRRDVYSVDNVYACSIARAGGWLCVPIAVSASPKQRYLILDEETMTIRREGVFIDGSPVTPLGTIVKVIALADRYFIALWTSGSNVRASLFDTTTPTVEWTTPVTLNSSVHATASIAGKYDAWAAPGGTEGYFAYNNTGGVAVIKVTVSAGAPTAAASQVYASALGDQGVAIAGDPALGHAYLALAFVSGALGGGTGLVLDVLNTSDLSLASNIVVDAAIDHAVEMSVLSYVEGGTPVATIAYSYFASSPTVEGAYTTFRRCRLSTIGVVASTGTEKVKGVYGWHRPFRRRGVDVFGVGRSQALENTYYSLTDPWAGFAAADGARRIPIARMLPYTAPTYDPSNTSFSSPDVARSSAGSDKFYTVAFEPALIAQGGAFTNLGNVAILTLSFDEDECNRSDVIKRMLVVAGSAPRYWEADQLAGLTHLEPPRGFVGMIPFHSPVIETLTAAATGGMTASKAYSYKFTFEYYNHEGRRCQSRPSTAKSVTLGGADGSVNMVLNTTMYQGPRMTGWPKLTAAVVTTRLVVWRTLADATNGIYYRAGDMDPDATAFTDSAGDTGISTNEILYTVGGELANEPAPPCLALVSWKGRIVALHSETHELWPSKSIIPGELPGFNNAVSVSTDVWRSSPVFVSEQDDNLIVWWEDAIGVVVGDPASDTGVGGTLRQPIVRHKGIGLAEVRSLVKTPSGTMFRGRNGIYLLGLDLSLQFIGAGVAGLVANPPAGADSIVAAYLITDRDEVHFVQQPYRVLVYDLIAEGWQDRELRGTAPAEGGGTVIVTPMLMGGCAWQHEGVLAWESTWYGGDASFVWAEDADAITDPAYTENPPTVMQSGWFSFAQLLGFQRVRRLLAVGTFPASCSITVDYDFTGTNTHTVTAFGTGVAGQVVDVELARQDCHALRLKCAGFGRLIGFRAEVEVEKGSYKRTATRV